MARLPIFTDDEIAALAAKHGCDVEDLAKRWIIQYGKSFYVMGPDGEYKKPIMREELGQSLLRDLQRVPTEKQRPTFGIDWTKKDRKGDQVLRPVEELVRNYCGHARYALADMQLQKSWFDADNETFYEAACPLADVKPVHHEQIAAWLKIFAGPQEEKLLDWIATLTRLDRPTCGLLLTGAPSSGKEMLAQGLTRRWRRSKAPTELKRIINDFNEDLTRCPLVFCDESLPASKNGRRLTGHDLRDMVATTGRTLARKFISNTDLLGSIRLILAANNHRMLESPDEQSRDDQHAMDIRFLHVRVTQAAADYLKSIGGRDATESWVAGGQIAEHAAWLEANRAVAPSLDRFVVMGDATDVQQQLLVNNKHAALVLEWLTRHIAAEGANSQQILVGNGKIYVNASIVASGWNQHVHSDFVPSMTRIGSALRMVSTGEHRIDWPAADGKVKEVRYHDVASRYVLEWSKQNQVGGAEALQATINRTVDVAKMIEDAKGPVHTNGAQNGSNGHPQPPAPPGTPNMPAPSPGAKSLFSSTH